VRLGTRGSALALAQAQLVAELLGDAEIVTVETSGDRGSVGDKARFVKELEEALLAGEVDLAVHSAKDVPATLPEGLSLVGVPDRADARDALCGVAAALFELPDAATVGTASVRRRSQLLALRPDLVVCELRGNVDTRLRRLAEDEFSAIVLACAGLARLGRSEGSPIAVAEMTPAAGQGCIALEARSDDAVAAEAAASITDPEALVRLTAERALVSALDATCDTPMGALASLEGQTLLLAAYAGLPDGSRWVRDRFEGPASEPAALGASIGERMVAAGAGEILDEAEALARSNGAGEGGR